MNFLRDTIHFFRREPKWAFLLGAVLVLFGLVQIRVDNPAAKGRRG